MNDRRLIKTTVLVGVFLAIILAAILLAIHSTRKDGLRACVVSIESEAAKAIDSDPALKSQLNLTAEGRLLTPDETRQVFEIVHKNNFFDCSNFPSFANGQFEDGPALPIWVSNDGRIRATVDY